MLYSYSNITSFIIIKVKLCLLPPIQVSVCDDYSLPVDFVKKIGGGGSAQSLHLATSLAASNPLTTEVVIVNEPVADSDRRSLKILAGYSHPKDLQQQQHQVIGDLVEECESNDQLRSSGNLNNLNVPSLRKPNRMQLSNRLVTAGILGRRTRGSCWHCIRP